MATIKYKLKAPYSDGDRHDSVAQFVRERLSDQKLGNLVDLLVARGVISPGEMFNIFKRDNEYLG